MVTNYQAKFRSTSWSQMYVTVYNCFYTLLGYFLTVCVTGYNVWFYRVSQLQWNHSKKARKSDKTYNYWVSAVVDLVHICIVGIFIYFAMIILEFVVEDCQSLDYVQSLGHVIRWNTLISCNKIFNDIHIDVYKKIVGEESLFLKREYSTQLYNCIFIYRHKIMPFSLMLVLVQSKESLM